MAMGVAQAVETPEKREKCWSSVQMAFRKPQNGGSRTNDRDGCPEPGGYRATGLKLMVDAEKSGKVIPLVKHRNLNWSIQSWSLNKTK